MAARHHESWLLASRSGTTSLVLYAMEFLDSHNIIYRKNQRFL